MLFLFIQTRNAILNTALDYRDNIDFRPVKYFPLFIFQFDARSYNPTGKICGKIQCRPFKNFAPLGTQTFERTSV